MSTANAAIETVAGTALDELSRILKLGSVYPFQMS